MNNTTKKFVKIPLKKLNKTKNNLVNFISSLQQKFVNSLADSKNKEKINLKNLQYTLAANQIKNSKLVIEYYDKIKDLEFKSLFKDFMSSTFKISEIGIENTTKYDSTYHLVTSTIPTTEPSKVGIIHDFIMPGYTTQDMNGTTLLVKKAWVVIYQLEEK